MMITIGIAIVDNQELIRAALGTLLQQEHVWEPGVKISLVGQDGADIVLVNVDGGLEALSPFSARTCIAYGRRSEPFFACRAILAGARTYVSTGSETAALVHAIAAGARGEWSTAPEVAQMLASGGGPASNLTAREHQTLELLARGLSNREIAEHLRISIKTVDTHRGHLKTKLNLRNNADITRFAIKHGYAAL